VLGDGTIVNANSEQNSDLFWALKGGGPNFGIVTQFELYTVPTSEVWYQFSVYSVDQANDILDAFVQWQKGGASDTKSTVGLVLGLDTILVGLLYAAPADQPDVFSPFYDIPALAVAVPGTNGTLDSLTAIGGASTSSATER
jgi:FAD/FMN-containing dehydrogenase